MKNTEPIPKEVRLAVLVRSGGFCERCGAADPLELHHVVSRRLGGPNVDTNLRALCEECHKVENRENSSAGRPIGSGKKEGEKFVPLIVRLHPQERERLGEIASTTGESVSGVVRRLVRETTPDFSAK